MKKNEDMNSSAVYFLCGRGCGKNLVALKYLLSLPPNVKVVDARPLITQIRKTHINRKEEKDFGYKSKIFFK